MTDDKKRITSFRDLEVYHNTYNAMLLVMKEVVPKLPDSEKYDLKDQLSRACKAIPIELRISKGNMLNWLHETPWNPNAT